MQQKYLTLVSLSLKDLVKKRKMAPDMHEDKMKKPRKEQSAPNQELDEEVTKQCFKCLPSILCDGNIANTY